MAAFFLMFVNVLFILCIKMKGDIIMDEYVLAIYVVYFIPTAIAILRRHKSVWAIALVNLTLGWLYGIGWFISLIWSLTGNIKENDKGKD